MSTGLTRDIRKVALQQAMMREGFLWVRKGWSGEKIGAEDSWLRDHHEQSQVHQCLQKQVARITIVCNAL